MAYSKEDLVGAALLYFAIAKRAGEQIVIESETNHKPPYSINPTSIDLDKLETMFNKFYDERGRDDFRKYASVDADKMRVWKAYNDKRTN